MSNAQHSSASNEHYTPIAVTNAARRTMGRIDLDPASCEIANRVVKANRFHAKENNGLLTPWFGKVFLNPPGGREFEPDEKHKYGSGRVNSQIWWPKLIAEWQSFNVSQAIFVGFSVEILQSSQGGPGPCALDFPFCVPKKRLAFLKEDLEPGKSPTHANVIVYLPSRVPEHLTLGIRNFREAFKDIGRVVVPT